MTGTVTETVLAGFAAAIGLGYLILAGRRRSEPQGWPVARTVFFLAGIALIVVALVPALSPAPHHSFTGHMIQHLLIGMYAPIGLALGAPVTLLLRSLPHRWARRLGRLLRHRAVGVLAHPVTALVLNLGGLAALYFSPLYAAMTTQPWLHHLVHAHFLVVGYLFAAATCGPDPAPRRPSVPARLVIIGVAILGHAVLSQLLYAGIFVQVPVPAADRQAGAELMYYAGDIAELLLAFAMVRTWRPDRRVTRRPNRRTTRRAKRPGTPAADAPAATL